MNLFSDGITRQEKTSFCDFYWLKFTISPSIFNISDKNVRVIGNTVQNCSIAMLLYLADNQSISQSKSYLYRAQRRAQSSNLRRGRLVIYCTECRNYRFSGFSLLCHYWCRWVLVWWRVLARILGLYGRVFARVSQAWVRRLHRHWVTYTQRRSKKCIKHNNAPIGAAEELFSACPSTSACVRACVRLARFFKLQNGLKDSDQMLQKYSLPGPDELLRVWTSRGQGQGRYKVKHLSELLRRAEAATSSWHRRFGVEVGLSPAFHLLKRQKTRTGPYCIANILWYHKKCARITWPLTSTLTLSTSWMRALLGTIMCKFGGDPAISVVKEVICAKCLQTETEGWTDGRTTDAARLH